MFNIYLIATRLSLYLPSHAIHLELDQLVQRVALYTEFDNLSTSSMLRLC